jgi:hypothetical protein
MGYDCGNLTKESLFGYSDKLLIEAAGKKKLEV